MCTVVPVSYLTHFSVSGETLALINSSLAPGLRIYLTEIWSLFLTPKHPPRAGGSPQPGAATRPAPPGRGRVAASPVSEPEPARAVVCRGNLTAALASHQAK